MEKTVFFKKNTPHTTKYDEKKSKKSRADTHYRQFDTSHETAPPNRTILQKKQTNDKMKPIKSTTLISKIIFFCKWILIWHLSILKMRTMSVTRATSKSPSRLICVNDNEGEINQWSLLLWPHIATVDWLWLFRILKRKCVRALQFSECKVHENSNFFFFFYKSWTALLWLFL